MTINELKYILGISFKDNNNIEEILDKFNYSRKVAHLVVQLYAIYEYLIKNSNESNPVFFREEAKRLKKIADELKNIDMKILIGENNGKSNTRNNE